jgi:hypothetical protein
MQGISKSFDKPEIIKVSSVLPDVKVTAHTNGNNFTGNLALLLRYSFIALQKSKYPKSFEIISFLFPQMEAECVSTSLETHDCLRNCVHIAKHPLQTPPE